MDAPDERPGEPGHSPWGIASFCIALACGVSLLIACAALLMQVQSRFGNWPMGLLSLDVLCGGPAAGLIGIPLGVAGILQKGTRRIFGVLGLTLNALFILSVLFLIFVVGPAIAQY